VTRAGQTQVDADAWLAFNLGALKREFVTNFSWIDVPMGGIVVKLSRRMTV